MAGASVKSLGPEKCACHPVTDGTKDLESNLADPRSEDGLAKFGVGFDRLVGVHAEAEEHHGNDAAGAGAGS